MTAPGVRNAAPTIVRPLWSACIFRLGNLTIRHASELPGTAAFMAEYYRLVQLPESAATKDGLRVDVELRIARLAPRRRETPAGDGSVTTTRGDEPRSFVIRSPLGRAVLTLRGGVTHLDVSLLADRDQLTDRTRYELFLILNRAWRLLDRLHLHAAAVHLDGRTYLFAGEKSAGKSTICIALARAGGIVLAEDHALLTRRSGTYLISGSDGILRVCPDAEEHFFAQPLAAAVSDFSGALKKELPLESVVACAPYTDYRVDAIVLPSIDRERPEHEGVRIRRAPRRAALIHFLNALRWGHRFADADEQQSHLHYLTGLVESAAVFILELGPHLRTLEQLSDRLKASAGGWSIADPRSRTGVRFRRRGREWPITARISCLICPRYATSASFPSRGAIRRVCQACASRIRSRPSPGSDVDAESVSREDSGGALRVGALGIAYETKRIDVLLRAAAAVLAENTRLTLEIVGPWGSRRIRDRLTQLARNLRIERDVHFVGETSAAEFDRRLKECDVVVNLRYPSHGEASAVMMRAFGAGKPVIASDIPAFLAHNPQLRLAMGRSAQQMVRSEAIWPVIASRYRTIIDDVLDCSDRA